MPKIKSSSSAKKRFAKTGSGKLKMCKAAHNHLLLQKSKKQKRQAKKPILLLTQINTLKKLIPYK
jgi:large subunit ribosomal protein L35